jgi:hypothetical protein
MNNFYFYWDEAYNNNSVASYSFTFDNLYNFMTGHQNSVDNYNATRQQGIVWSYSEPDSDLGWYYTDPPDGDGNLSFSNPAHAQYYPRKGIMLMATLGDGTAYNRGSRPAAQWRVPNEVGTANGMGTSGMLLSGSYGQNNGGIRGDRTLADVYPGYASSTFVRIAQTLQDAEDAIYSRDWLTNADGKGSYLNHIDIDSFIDWQIAHEMLSDWEVIVLNGRYAHYDPAIGKLKMGPIWDMDGAWINGERNATPGFIRKTPFWYKELLGWEVTNSNLGGTERPERKDPYYISRLKARWGEVKSQFNTELNPYIEATNARFQKITGYSNQPVSINGDRNGLKNTMTNMINALNPVIGGY